MSLINVINLSFTYDGSYDSIFENVNFQIDTDWRLGFTGRNGRGKTTFLNLMLGKFSYSGAISSSVPFEYFPFAVENTGEHTIDVVHSILQGKDGYEDFQEWELFRELSLLCVNEDVLYRPYNTLSNGEQTKVLLVALFLTENKFLLIDEPTNHLDATARKIVSDYLRTKKGFILVSHDRAFLDNCIDHILSINKASIEIQRGNFSSWWYNKELQDNFETAENEKLKRDIGRLDIAKKRTANWSDKVEKTKIGTGALDKGFIGHKAAKLMKRSKSIEKRQDAAISEKSTLLKNIERYDPLKMHPIKYHSDTLIEFDNVGIMYDAKTVCSTVNFSLSRGERIALQGENGSGKSSILKLICEGTVAHSGTFKKGNNLSIAYVSQDTSHLQGNLCNYARAHDIDESLFKATLNKLDFSKDQFSKDIRNFSAGQKKKVLIAQSLCIEAHVYIWDEPLNYIDVFSRIQIEQLLLAYAPTMIFVEHDSIFCDKIATKFVKL